VVVGGCLLVVGREVVVVDVLVVVLAVVTGLL
jgi:hypothetical protein